jgi:iron complex transport system substrate-binding protein
MNRRTTTRRNHPSRYRKPLSLLAIAAVLLAAPCMTKATAHAQLASRQGVAAPATRRVTDEVGRSVEIPQPVKRIVSLAPSVTETLFALGLGDRVVGDTNYCDYPPEAKSRAHVGGPVDPNLEAIAALHPDLVLVARSINREATVHSLEQLGIAVYATDPRNVQQVLDSSQRLGELLGAGDGGASVVTDLRKRLDQLRANLAGQQPKSVLFVVWETPLISVGRDTFLADALRSAGAISVISTRQDWPEVSLEEVVKLQPDYLIFSNDEPDKLDRQIAQLRNQPGWRDLQALKENHIVLLSEAISRPAPRLLDAIEQLARALHPERFAEQYPGQYPAQPPTYPPAAARAYASVLPPSATRDVARGAALATIPAGAL